MSNFGFARQCSRILSPCLTGTLLFVLVGAHVWGVLPVKAIFLLSAIVLLRLAFQAAPRLSSKRERTIATALFTGAVLLQALPEVLHARATSLYEFGWRTSVAMSGWSFILSLIPLQREDTTGTPSGDRNTERLFLLLIALFVALTGIHFAIRDRYAVVVDEVLYLLQGKLLLEPAYTRAIDPSVASFFVTRQSYVLDGRLNGQYPPGWPLFLALFEALGLRWFTPICLGLLAVTFVYLLGKQLRSPDVGLLAAALLSTSFWFLYSSSTYYSHSLSMALALAAAWHLLRAERQPSLRRLLWWAVAGIELATAMVTRPLTGIALTSSLWIWIVLRGTVHGLDIVKMTFAVCLGSVAPLLFLLHYNHMATGSPLLFGYHVANGPLHDLGFGQRGMIVYGAAGDPTALVETFTPALAALHLSTTLRSVSVEFVPAFIIAPLLVLALRYKVSIHWRSASAFLVLPVLHFFYYFSGSRFYVELLPFLWLATAMVVNDIKTKDGRVGQLLLCFFLTGNVFFSGLWLHEDYVVFRERFKPYIDVIVDLHRQKGNVLVFVKDVPDRVSGIPRGHEVLFEALWWFNVDRFPGSVIVARDLGAQNAELTKRWPDHYPVRISNEGTKRKPQRPSVVPLKP